jgi:3-hydroxyisobutyrate dehydrogenase|tara:strand:+ start:1281 stop:2156 length:876 start_codon:yes stop_codon:yes gene_type:complete
MKLKENYIGFVGLGSMGSVMVSLLSKEKFNLIAYDINKEIELDSNIACAENLRELVDCNILILILPNGSIVKETVLQLVEYGFKGQVIDMSSSHPQQTIELQELVKQNCISIVDAPVSGGVKKAINGTLMVMVGCIQEDFKAIKILLECFGTVRHIGPLGAGHAMKALNNYVSASGLLASMQALATAEAYGIKANDFIEVINSSTGKNNSTQVKFLPFVIPRKYDSGFSLSLMTKDVEIASSIIKDAKFSTPLSNVLPEYLTEVLKNLKEGVDHTALYEEINPRSVTETQT